MAVADIALDRHVEISRSMFEDLSRTYGPRDFAVRFWNGDEWGPDVGQPTNFTIVLKHPGALRSMFVPPGPVEMGRAFMYDDFDVEGDMVEFVAYCNFLHGLRHKQSWLEKASLAWRLMRLPNTPRPRVGRQAVKLSGRKHSAERDKQAISYHYDFSNNCFEHMLGPTMGYSCGVYEHENDSIDEVQTRKFDVVCRKLRLQPGERLLDIGCGWGGMIMHAVKNYGVEAVGVTLSEQQAIKARQRIADAGLEGRCRVELVDYREHRPERPYDKIVSLEMIEAIGPKMFPTFFAKCWELLKPQGQMCLQVITLSGETDTTAAPGFSQAYVFPDGELAPVSTLLRFGERRGFEVRDVEGFREHYVRTLRDWLGRTEQAHDEIVATTDEPGYRTFRIYFAAACYGFVANVYNLHQVLFAKPDSDADSGLPLTRNDWYT